VLRQSLSRPRLLRQLHEQVVGIVLGDGFSIALCNKKEAATGVIAAQEICECHLALSACYAAREFSIPC